jgi:ferric-dicitrate binding protein FerR (iron transport regulator)
MEITRLALTKDGNETGNDMRGRFAEIKLSRGRIFVSHSWGEARARFSLATSEGEITTPSNALFIVQSEEQKTRVTCASGWVEFRPASSATATRIPPGSVGEWPSASSNLTKAETDPVAQEDLQQAVEVEQMLRGLVASKRNILPR